MTSKDLQECQQSSVTATPTRELPASKRTRRQAKITDSFSVGRRSARLTEVKDVLASPTLRKKTVYKPKEKVEEPEEEISLKLEAEKNENAPTTKEIIEATSPLVTAAPDEEEKVNDNIKLSNDVSIPSTPEPIKQVEMGKVEEIASVSSNLSLSSSAISIPAYQKYAHLTVGPRPLPLPSSFIHLEKVLSAIDSICMLSAGRDQPVIFHKSIKTLESTVNRRVEQSHLEQLNWIFSNEKFGEPVPFLSVRPTSIIMQGKRVESFALELPETASHDYLHSRKSILYMRLLSLVNEAHDKFLSSINVKLPAGAKLKTWHPRFNLESVDEVGIMELISSKTIELENYKVAEVVKQVINENIKQTGELVKVKEESSSKPESSEVKTSVLDRIRAKQREKEVKNMLDDPVKEALRRKYTSLLEFSETIAMLFASHNKNVLLMGEVIGKISNGSVTPISPNELMEKVESLISLAPDWVEVRTAGSVKTLRINRSISLSSVKAIIQAKLASI